MHCNFTDRLNALRHASRLPLRAALTAAAGLLVALPGSLTAQTTANPLAAGRQGPGVIGTMGPTGASTPAASAVGGRASDHPELRAQLSARRYTTLAAEIGARIQKLTITEGQSIKAGQLLVSLDCSLQNAQLEKAQATLGAAEKQLATQKRLVELNATGKQEMDQAESEVAKTRAEMNQIRVQLGKCAIHAPFGGRVAEQKVREQQYVQAGQALMEIIDDSVLEVEFIMPSRWLADVKVGSDVKIAVDETGRDYAAKVQRLGAKVDPVSQSVKVIAAIQGRPQELVAGMSGRVFVQR